MRVFVAVQPTPKSGPSKISRYIAESKIDRDKEQLTERGSRPLFSEREDDLTYNEADRILNPTSGELEKEDVMHVVVSPEPGAFEHAGETDEERRESFREAMRDAVREMARELKVRFLNWIGGIHENTRTPHGHLAVSRWALDEKTGKLVYIKHLPESLLPRQRVRPDGTKRFDTGKIARVFARAFNLKQRPIRFVQVQDPKRGLDMARSVVSPHAAMLLGTTPEQRLVGRWIEAELTLARAIGEGVNGREELTRECIELRALVAELDAGSRAQGARPTAGYIEPEKLGELLGGNNGGLRVSISTERPNGQQEKYVEHTTGQSGSRAEETQTVPQELERGEVKASVSNPQVITNPSPTNAAQVKLISPQEVVRAHHERASSERPGASRAETPRGSKGVEAREAPRVASHTLASLRAHTVLSRNADEVIDKASETRDAPKAHDGGTQQKGTKEEAHVVDRAALVSPATQVDRTERAPLDAGNIAGNLAATKEPVKDSQLNDKDLGSMAHNIHVGRLCLERGHQDLRAGIMREAGPIQWGTGRDGAGSGDAYESLVNFQWILREAILLDGIYDSARERRNIPSQRLSDREESILKGRESLLGMQLSTLAAMDRAQERLPAVASLAHPDRVNEYHKHRENLALELERAREIRAEAASRVAESRIVETLEHDSHATLDPALPVKEVAPSREEHERGLEYGR